MEKENNENGSEANKKSDFHMNWWANFTPLSTENFTWHATETNKTYHSNTTGHDVALRQP